MLFSGVGFARSVACVSGYRKVKGRLFRRFKLLCSASAVALFFADPGVAGQLPASAFQSYSASAASSIAAGPFALYTVPVNDIHPTQANLGFAEIGKKVSAYDLLTPSGLANDLLSGGSIEPVVIGPGGKLYLTNGHHTFTSLQQSIYGASNPLVYVNVIANYSNLTEAEFWAKMQASNFLLPLDNGIVQPVDPLTGSPIPAALSGMTNDPYRGLEYSILKNKSSKLFPTAANITGAVGSSIPGLDKTAAYYSDFIWANAYRNANNGLGLPYLSPGDVALATQWNLNGANVTKLQQGGADVTVAQLPGYILSNSLNISSVIDTNTVNSGVLDGNGGFTGLRGLDLGSVTIGTPASTTGFILQLGADRGGTVTLSGNNTYAGGTTILAGTLVINNDANLGAASPVNPDISSIRTADDVRANNGIVFNSLSEGNGTLQINSSMTLDRPIGVGGETAIINANGNTVTLAGTIVSLDDNANGFSDLTIGGGTVVLAPTTGSNPYFYGNWIISGGTLQASSDAALGNTTGPGYTIGQIVLDGGIFKAGASFDSVRSLTLTGGSTFDTNGFTTSFAGTLTDVQRKLTITNSSANNGTVTFGSLNISGTNTTTATGATSTLAFKAVAGSGQTTVNLTDGVTRTDRSTLFIQPSSATTLGTSEFVFSGVGASTLTNAMAPAWMISDSGGKDAYDFLTYDPVKGYVKATYTKIGSGSSGGIRAATANDIVEQTGNATLSANAAAYALKIDSGYTITAGNGTTTNYTIALGNGVDPAGLILGGSGSNTAGISGGTLAFGGSEGIIYARSTSGLGNVISSTITGTNGLTLAGQGMLTLSTASPGLSGAVNIDSGTLNLSAANAFINVSSVNLSNVKSSPAAAGLSMSASNAFASLNSAGSNSSITVSGANTVLTIGQTGNANAALNNLDSTISSTITATDVAAGSAAIVKAGSGLLDLSGAKLNLTTGSNIAVNAGTLRVGGSSFTNTNNIVTAGGSEVQFASNAGGLFAGNITGGGTMHLIGGTLKLTGTGNTYLGGTIVEQGSILDLTTANVSSGNANIVNAGGLVVFDQATNGTYSGVISDGCQMMLACTTKLSGSLIKDDSTGGNTGNVTLGAVQTYTGGTFIEAGTLTLGLADVIFSSAGVDLGRVGGGATATLALMADNTIKGLMSEKGNTTTVQLNDKTLTVNTANGQMWDFGGAITGSGGFVKSGAGIQILSGDSSSFTGATNIVDGMLVVNGLLGGSMDIGTGGRLQGTGTVGNTVVNGTIAPSMGALNVAGNITFNPNSIYEVEVNAAGASDKILASGTATIDGGTVKVLAGTGNYAALTPYTILTATGGLAPNSAFDGATSNLAFLDPWLSYDAKNVYLTMVRNNIDFAAIGITPNQIATGAGAESLGFGNPVYNAVLSLSAEQAQYAFDQLSGEIHASAKTALIEDSRFIRDAVNDRLRAAFDGVGVGGTVVTYENGEPRTVAANTNRFAAWGQGFGSWGHTEDDGNAARLNRSTAGLFIGADAPVFDTWRFGAVAGFSRTNFDVKDRNSSGSSDNYHVGVYGGTHWGLAVGYLAFRTGAAYTWHDISTSRGVMFPGFVDSLKGEYNAGTAQVFGEMAYGLNAGSARFESFANLAYVNLRTDGFTERGGAAALISASANTEATFSTLGLRSSTAFDFNGAIFTAKGAVGWRHAFDDVTPLSTMRFAGGDAFTVGGVPITRDAAVLEAGLDYMLTSNATLGVSYNGQLGSDSTDQSVRANFDVRF